MPQSVRDSCIEHHHSTFIDAQAKRLELSAGLLLFCMTWHGHLTDYQICMRPGAGSDFLDWTVCQVQLLVSARTRAAHAVFQPA